MNKTATVAKHGFCTNDSGRRFTASAGLLQNTAPEKRAVATGIDKRAAAPRPVDGRSVGSGNPLLLLGRGNRRTTNGPMGFVVVRSIDIEG